MALAGQSEPFQVRSHDGGPGAGTRRAGEGPARRTWMVATDVLWLLVMVLSVPFVILAVGIPVALVIQLLLWIGRLL